MGIVKEGDVGKPSDRTVKKHLKELRALIENEATDEVTRRIAYAMECAVRWATEDTVGWNGLAQEARDEAWFLRQELKAARVGG